MTETTEKQKEMAERYHSTDSKDLKIMRLEAQVTSLTKERDELKADVKENHEAATVFYNDWIEEQNKNISLKSQLSNKEKEIKPVIDCLKEILFETLDADSIGIDNEFIQNVGLKHGCLTQRCPTEEELEDPEWFGREYGIKEGECAVIEINLPDLLQSK